MQSTKTPQIFPKDEVVGRNQEQGDGVELFWFLNQSRDAYFDVNVTKVLSMKGPKKIGPRCS